MGAALALAERARGRTAPNPGVGCVIVNDGRVVGRGWTQPGGRPHAEAVALAAAGEGARGATAYVTLEPCVHESARGPACFDLLIAAGVARVVAGRRDPDPRTDGQGFARLAAAGVEIAVGVRATESTRAIAGFLTRRRRGRPLVTLKLATSLDGCIALACGESRWITGAEARAHAHLERSRHETILVGRGTWETDRPGLDVRLAGLEARSPERVVLSSRHSGIPTRHPDESRGLIDLRTSARRDPDLRQDDGVAWISAPEQIAALPGDHLLVEGGAATATAFLRADLVDRLLLYRAPVLLGGRPALADLNLTTLTDAHGRWMLTDACALGSDRVEVYERRRE